MGRTELKQRAFAYIDSIRETIIRHGKTVEGMPELGYREQRTSAYVKQEMERLSLADVRNVAYTGVASALRPRAGGENVCLIGELDAVLTPDCPYADPATGAAHTCGHNIQIAQLLGCADAIKNSGIARELDGNVTFLAVPAEEFVDLDYRRKLKEEGRIQKLSGKQELIASGFFRDVSCAMMVHSQPNCPEAACFIDCRSLGFVAKKIRFIGKAAHAGGAPYEGINALNAAMAAIMCIHAMRETFRDEDKIRVHPIITHGGDLVNIVPADVTMETYVRGATPSAVEDACAKVDRAIRGAAYAVGAQVEITDVGGYAPLQQNRQLGALFEENAKLFLDGNRIYHGVDMVGSTDMGDLSLELPAIQPTFGGYCGGAHSAEFRSVDDEITHILPVKILTATVIDLLADRAQNACRIREEFVQSPSEAEQPQSRLAF